MPRTDMCVHLRVLESMFVSGRVQRGRAGLARVAAGLGWWEVLWCLARGGGEIRRQTEEGFESEWRL